MGNNTAIYTDQGRWQDAEALQAVVLEHMKLVLQLGDEHPHTHTTAKYHLER